MPKKAPSILSLHFQEYYQKVRFESGTQGQLRSLYCIALPSLCSFCCTQASVGITQTRFRLHLISDLQFFLAFSNHHADRPEVHCLDPGER